jgi:hypothetical protein
MPLTAVGFSATKPSITFPIGSQGIAHFIGSEKAANKPSIQGVLMVEFY